MKVQKVLDCRYYESESHNVYTRANLESYKSDGYMIFHDNSDASYWVVGLPARVVATFLDEEGQEQTLEIRKRSIFSVLGKTKNSKKPRISQKRANEIFDGVRLGIYKLEVAPWGGELLVFKNEI